MFETFRRFLAGAASLQNSTTHSEDLLLKLARQPEVPLRLSQDFIQLLNSTHCPSELIKSIELLTLLRDQDNGRLADFGKEVAQIRSSNGQTLTEAYRIQAAKDISEVAQILLTKAELTGPKVLSFGTGNGLLAKSYADASAQRVMGCDLTQELDPSLRLELALIENSRIPFTSDTFSSGFAHCSLHNVPDPEKMVKEISRVVRSKFCLVEDVLSGEPTTVAGITIPMLITKNGVEKRDIARPLFRELVTSRWLEGSERELHGNYLTAKEWKSLFEKYDWKTTADLPVTENQARRLHATEYRYFIFER
jgi:SAM-dependent methyltransferase